MQSESSLIHVLCGHRKPKAHYRAMRYERDTVFGRRYLGVAIDEAHGFRNANKLYGAVHMLRDKTDILVAMTATPVQTRPLVCLPPWMCARSYLILALET